MTGALKMAKLDFYTLKAQLSSYLALVLIMIMFWFMNSSLTTLYFTVAWFVALMSANIFAIQEKNGLHRLYGSIALSRKDIVLGRYVFVLLNFAILLAAVIVLHAGVMLIQNKALVLSEMLIAFSVSFLVFSLITGVQMPIYFKMGYTRARAWSMVPFIAVMGLSALAVLPPIMNNLPEVVRFAKSNQSALIAVGILAGFVIEFISYRISIIAYRKRH